MENNVFDVRLKLGSTTVICGPSGSGKTELVKRLIRHRNEMLDESPKRIVWCYGVYQHSLNAFMEENNIVVHRGLPQDLENFIQPYDMIIFDDLMNQMKSSEMVTSLFTKLSHHKPCFAVFLVQHLYFSTKDAAARSQSTSYIIYMKSVRGVRQVRFLAGQIYSQGCKFLSSAYAYATREPYSYLFMDMRSETPDPIRIRTNIFPDDNYQSAFLPNVVAL